ncbi:MAG TPA: M1 family aminopeptidase [Kofleriaceae bacterium]|nr:M1 family aminopeptidase [Kofleriaceae bacterium]
MRRALLLCGVALTACGGDDAPPTGAIEYQTLHYDFAFDLDSHAAASAVTLSITAGGDCLDIPMRAPGLAELTLDGAPPTSAGVDGGVLHVCGAGWFEGDELQLRVTDAVAQQTWSTETESSQVGYSESLDREGKRFRYLVSWIGGCDQFGPCDNRPDRFATYTFTVSHPEGVVVLCPGTITAGATETVCDFPYPGGPTYSTFGIAATESWTPTDLGTWGDVHVTFYDTPSTGVVDAIDTDYLAGFLGFMEDHFGPYPYGSELRFATGPTHWGGFEHPGNILLTDGLATAAGGYADPVNHTATHELTHMWAGDQTTLADTYDFAWKESMAEYLSFVYEDESQPAAVAQLTAHRWKQYAGSSAYYPVPEEHPVLLDYYLDTYNPGPMILFRQLEVMFSRDAVLAALADLLGAQRAISVDDVQAALEEHTGADLSGYLDAWLRGSGEPVWPSVTVDVADAGGGDVDVTVTPTAGSEPFGCAFTVELTGDGGESLEVAFDRGVDGGAEPITVTATPGFAVTGHVLDPRAQCLISEASSAAAGPRRSMRALPAAVRYPGLIP